MTQVLVYFSRFERLIKHPELLLKICFHTFPGMVVWWSGCRVALEVENNGLIDVVLDVVFNVVLKVFLKGTL